MAKPIIQYLTSAEVVTMMKARQGGKQQNEFAEEICVSPQMLSEIYKGTRFPSPAVLEFLGKPDKSTIEKVTMYRLTRGGKL